MSLWKFICGGLLELFEKRQEDHPKDETPLDFIGTTYRAIFTWHENLYDKNSAIDMFALNMLAACDFDRDRALKAISKMDPNYPPKDISKLN